MKTELQGGLWKTTSAAADHYLQNKQMGYYLFLL